MLCFIEARSYIPHTKQKAHVSQCVYGGNKPCQECQKKHSSRTSAYYCRREKNDITLLQMEKGQSASNYHF